jgi:hypothetical protein
VPVLINREPGLHLGRQRRLELAQLRPDDDVVGELVTERAHRLELVQLRAGDVRALGRDEHPEAMKLELDAVLPHLVDQREHALTEARDRLDAVTVIAVVAVRPEPQQPRRELEEVDRLEVQRRIGVEQRAHSVQGQSRLRQRTRLGRAYPPAVTPRSAAADAVGFDDDDLQLALTQVVRAAEAGDARSHDDGRTWPAHDGTDAVT